MKIKTDSRATEKFLKNLDKSIIQACVEGGKKYVDHYIETAKKLSPQPGQTKTISGKYKGKKYLRTGKFKNSIRALNKEPNIINGRVLFIINVCTGYEFWVEFGKKGGYGWKDQNPKHRFSTYPGANAGKGVMRLAMETTRSELNKFIVKALINLKRR